VDQIYPTFIGVWQERDGILYTEDSINGDKATKRRILVGVIQAITGRNNSSSEVQPLPGTRGFEIEPFPGLTR